MGIQYSYRGVPYQMWSYFRGEPGSKEKDWRPKVRHIENLIDLVDALRFSPPPEFDMNTFGSVKDREDVRETVEVPRLVRANLHRFDGNERPWVIREIGKSGADVQHICGTSCCAVGTAAFHGIGIPGRGLRDMDWEDYCAHAFGMDAQSQVWDYLFEGDWSKVDNTANGAAARILSLVIEGPNDLFKKITDGVPAAFREDHLFGQWHDEPHYMGAAKSLYEAYLTMPVEPK